MFPGSLTEISSILIAAIPITNTVSCSHPTNNYQSLFTETYNHVNLMSRMCPTKIFPGQILSCLIRALFQLCTITQILFIFTQNKSQDVADEAADSQSLLLNLTKVIFNILSESYLHIFRHLHIRPCCDYPS